MQPITVILSCGQKKLKHKARAFELYQGAYFKAALGWAKVIAQPERVYILSAKYGLIRCTQRIEPYDARMGTSTQIVTKQQVIEQAKHFGLDDGCPIFCGGSDYSEILRAAIPGFINLSDHMNTPGKGMGYQIQWFTNNHGKLPPAIFEKFNDKH